MQGHYNNLNIEFMKGNVGHQLLLNCPHMEDCVMVVSACWLLWCWPFWTHCQCKMHGMQLMARGEKKCWKMGCQAWIFHEMNSTQWGCLENIFFSFSFLSYKLCWLKLTMKVHDLLRKSCHQISNPTGVMRHQIQWG